MRSIMNVLRGTFGVGVLIGLGIELLGRSTTAQTAPLEKAQSPAPGLRRLTGDDAQRAEELRGAIEAALKANHWEEAIARTEELLALQARVQGPKYFETLNTKW